MEAIPVLKMRSLKLSILHCLLVLGGTSWFELSDLPTTPMKSSCLLFTRLPTHRILFLMYMLHTAHGSSSFFAFISSTAPLAW